MNTLDIVYRDLLGCILTSGVEKKDRTGTGTKSIFGYQIRHDMREGFPLLTTKKMAWKSIVTELLWFLRGDTNIKYLVDNDCHIWDGDAYKRYVICTPIPPGAPARLTKEEFINKIKTDNKFAKQWGDLGPTYGKQWRDWEPSETYSYGCVDQIANLINNLKTNPDSRRLMVSAWNVGEVDHMVLPPCHYGFQVYTRELSLEERIEMIQPLGMDALAPEAREKWMEENNIPTRAISLMWSQRSVDVGLGLGFNIASYGLLLEIIAKEVNMVPDELIGSLGDCHLYLDHVEPIKVQLEREPFELPKLKIKPNLFEFGKPDPNKLELDYYSHSNFELENYKSHPRIILPLSN